jgi:hypothetical protein
MPKQWGPTIEVGSAAWVLMLEAELAELQSMDESQMTPQRRRMHHDRLAHLGNLLQAHEHARPRAARPEQVE